MIMSLLSKTCQNRHADEETLAARDIMGRTLLHYAATLGRLGALSFDGTCSFWIPPFRSTHSSRIEATSMYDACTRQALDTIM